MSQGRVLVGVVDDDPSVRRALRRVLVAGGFAAEVFASGEEFLGRAHDGEIRCLILDNRMPGMSGPELQRRLRSLGRRVPVIFITGHQDPHVRKQVLEEGAFAWLEKPFEQGELLDAVRRAVQGGPEAPEPE